MAHEITVREDGTAEAAFALTPAWHGLGAVLDHAMTAAEVLREAHLDWSVEKRDVFLADGTRVPEHQATVRGDNGLVLGVVSRDWYTPFQNAECVAFMNALAGESGMQFEAAGSLKGGKRVWLLGRMPHEVAVVPADTMREYILFSTGHDGAKSIDVMETSVRVVCWNTLRWAEARQQGERNRSFAIAHLGSLQSRLAEAKRALGLAHQVFEDQIELARELLTVTVDNPAMDRYLELVFPVAADATKRKEENVQRRRGEVASLFRDDPRQTMAGVAHTGWAALNAVTHWVDHRQVFGENEGNTDSLGFRERRFNRVLLGEGARMKDRATTIAARMFAPAYAEEVLDLVPIPVC